MGDYTVLRGKVQIKPHLIDILHPRFTALKDDNPSSMLCSVKGWEELDLPDEIKATMAYRTLTHPLCRVLGGWTPGGNSFSGTTFDDGVDSEVDHENRMLFSESGLLDFVCGHKNSSWDVLKAFIALMPLIADSWLLELDESDWNEPSYDSGYGMYGNTKKDPDEDPDDYRYKEHSIKTFRSEKDPTLADHIAIFEQRAYIDSKHLYETEHPKTVQNFTDAVGRLYPKWSRPQLRFILSDGQRYLLAEKIPYGYPGPRPALICVHAPETEENKGKQKNSVIFSNIDYFKAEITVVFPGITKPNEALVFKDESNGPLIVVDKDGNESVLEDHTLVDYLFQYFTTGTIPSINESKMK